MDKSMDKVIDKIRKLLALSGSSNESEAASALAKAQAMLAENNLTLEDVAGKDVEGFTIDRTMSTTAYPWRRQLANAVASLYFCKYFFQTLKVKASTHDLHCFAGKKHNIEVAKLMFGYLHATVDRLAREEARGLPTKQQSPFRVSFRLACTRRLCARIYHMIEEAKQGAAKASDGKSNLPALRNMYEQAQTEVSEFVEEEVGSLTEARSKEFKNKDYRGTLAGDRAGNSISLNAQVGGGATAKVGFEGYKKRAKEIEDLVRANYCEEDTDAADLAMEELRQNAHRTNDEVARAVAQRIMQP